MIKNWRWLEIIAVHPDFQGRRIAHALGFLSYRQAYPLQPASAYSWPIESVAGSQLLTKWGVLYDGKNKVVLPFGKDAGRVVQHWHAAYVKSPPRQPHTARAVARRIAHQAGAPNALAI